MLISESMSILKVNRTREILHGAGVKRVTRTAIAYLDEAIEDMVTEIGKDLSLVYPNRLIESADVFKVSEIKKGYRARLKEVTVPKKSLEDLVSDIDMPEGAEEAMYEEEEE